MDTTDTACAHLEGSGCAGGAPPCLPEDSVARESAVDTAVGGFEGESVCAPHGSAVFLFSIVVWGVRRVLPLLLVALPAWAGVDAQLVSTQDGGRFPTLVEADLGTPWDPQIGVGLNRAAGLVTAVTTERVPLLEEVDTLELGVSMRFGGAMRVGVSLPVHTGGVWAGTPFGPRPGDTSVWVRIPLREAERGPLLAWSVQADVPTGDAAHFLGEPDGRIHGTLAAELPVRAWQLAGNLDLGLALPSQLLDEAWGSRLGWAFGVQRGIVGPLHATVETSGSVGLPPAGTVGDLPVEVDLSAGGTFFRALSVDVGGGFGLTRGLGSPSSRLLLVASVRAPPSRDTDADGLVDRRDDCPVDPEDRDHVRDADGCPEIDADADQILDEVDACPVVAEVHNTIRDTDGCPDVAVALTVVVEGRDAAHPVETARLRLGGLPEGVVLGGEEVVFVVEPGTHRVEAAAAGFHPVTRELEVGGDMRVTLPLAPVEIGTLFVQLTEEDGAPLAGWMQPGSAPPIAIPTTGLEREVPSGPHAARVYAEGHEAVRVDAEVPSGGRVEVRVPLARIDVGVADGSLTLTRAFRFDPDSDVVVDEALLDALAAWLRAHPEIELLRVEGHADEVGPPIYNLDLSRRRAQAVVDGLVARGVASARLEALGSGEARAGRESPRRLVDLLVLVWATDGEAPPEPPPVATLVE